MAKFNEMYENIYRECHLPLENMRKQAKNKIIITLAIAVFVAIGLMIIFQNPSVFILPLIIAAFIIAFSKKIRRYNSVFKEKVVKTFVKEYSEKLNYEPHKGLASTIYREGEFERFDRYRAEDYISGTLGEFYRIDMSEVHTEEESRDSDGDRTYYTLFHGLFARVEFDKLITEPIKIRKNTIKIFDRKERIEMDSGEFEKTYDVYSENKIVAMQLLTADIMQMFLDFKAKNGIAPELTIKGNKLYIRFATGDVFEANILKKALDYDTLQKYYNTIEFTLGITEKMVKNITETEI